MNYSKYDTRQLLAMNDLINELVDQELIRRDNHIKNYRFQNLKVELLSTLALAIKDELEEYEKRVEEQKLVSPGSGGLLLQGEEVLNNV